MDNSPAIGPDGTIYLPSSIGLSAFTQSGVLKWNYAAVGNSYSTPAISSDGTVFIAGWDMFYAINADGSLRWSIEMEDDVRSSPAIGVDGTVYIGSKDNYLYALNPFDGTEKWKFDAGSFVLTAPIIDTSGVIYFGSYYGKFYALNPDGTEKWFYQFSEDLGFIENNGATIGDNNVIYLGASDPEFWFIRKVYALNLDGSLKWEFKTDLPIDTPTALATDGTIYIGATDGTLLALEGESTGLANSPWPKYRGHSKNTGLGIDSPGNNTGVQSIMNQRVEVKCFPNPFMSSTHINFSLHTSASVIIKIYNVLGAEIKTLYVGEKQPGNHTVVFDATNIEGHNTQQIYLCKIQIGNQIKTSILIQNM